MASLSGLTSAEAPAGSTVEGLFRLAEMDQRQEGHRPMPCCWLYPPLRKWAPLGSMFLFCLWGNVLRSRPEVVKRQAGGRWSGCSLGALLREGARAAVLLTTDVGRLSRFRSRLPRHGSAERSTRHIVESPALLRGTGHSRAPSCCWDPARLRPGR